jgi:hypothetical protein
MDFRLARRKLIPSPSGPRHVPVTESQVLPPRGLRGESHDNFSTSYLIFRFDHPAALHSMRGQDGVDADRTRQAGLRKAYFRVPKMPALDKPRCTDQVGRPIREIENAD